MFFAKHLKSCFLVGGKDEYTKPFESCYIRLRQMIKNLLYIIRWPNLLMLGGIQTIVYTKLLYTEQSVLSIPLFIVLTLITILLAASGYVINDLYDVEIDRINKPEKQIAGKTWSISAVKTLYFVLIAIGAILSFGLGQRLGLLGYFFIYPIAVTGLWFYSFALKCKPVIGNLWVSFFCAGVVLIVALPDLILQHGQYIKEELQLYMAFAFLTTWLREVVKDIEDHQGDAAAFCRTAVVRWGVKAGKGMALLLSLLLIASLILWENRQPSSGLKFGLNLLQGLTLAAMAFVWWAKSKSYYHYASNLIKLVMAVGTGLLLLI